MLTMPDGPLRFSVTFSSEMIGEIFMRILPVFLVFNVLLLSQGIAAETTVIAAFGDSLTAGYGLEPVDAFPVQLQQKLNGDGYTGVKVINDGVSGDTTADGLART